MKRTYQRSQILHFYELSEEQQLEALNNNDDAKEHSYVLWNNTPISLSKFMRLDSGLFHGYFSTSAFDGFLIRINKTQECATIVNATI